jgi:hypothetical protein
VVYDEINHISNDNIVEVISSFCKLFFFFGRFNCCFFFKHKANAGLLDDDDVDMTKLLTYFFPQRMGIYKNI